MKTNDEIFAKEFKEMMQYRRGICDNKNLYDIPLPNGSENYFRKENHEMCIIRGIEDEYYSKLNNTEAIIWSKGQLRSRLFDYKGEFQKDKEGNIKKEDVTLPHGCIAIFSDVNIHVPNKYKPKDKELFEYVDYTEKEVDEEGNKKVKYLYIIPRKYCYKINQTALVISWNKLRVYYSGIKLSLMNGEFLYMCIIPYKPTQSNKPYRVLKSKTTCDYNQEVSILKDFWVKNNVMFNPAVLGVSLDKTENLAYERMDGVLDEYVKFDEEHSMLATEDEDMLE